MAQLQELFSGQKRYRVPRYQRRYVWRKENWEALWRDLTQLPDGRKHFTGSIITKSDGNDEDRIIIDGQQRLITFQIIFRLIQDLWEAGECLPDSLLDPDRRRRRIHDVRVLTQDDDLKGEYRLIITKEDDREAFQLILSGERWKKIKDVNLSLEGAFESLYDNGFKDKDKNEQSEQNLITTAYGYFGWKIIKRLDDKGPDELLKLLYDLKYQFHVNSANLETDDDPQQAFGSANGTGVLLDEFDLLRNDLFLRVKDSKKQEVLYNEHWRIFDDNPFWIGKKPDEFLENFLIAKLGPKADFSKRLFHHVYKGEYFQKLKDELGKDENNLEFIRKELDELTKYAETYEQMGNPSTEIHRRRQFYEDLNSIFENPDPASLPPYLASLPPFMLYVANELGLEVNERDRVYQVLESYILRCQLRHGVNEDKTATRKVNDLFDALIKGTTIDIKKHKAAETVADYLDSERRGREWLSDEKILKGLLRVGFQREYSSKSDQKPIWNMLSYIFYRIECSMQETVISFKSFKERFSDPELILIRAQSRVQNLQLSYSIGNLTFCGKPLPAARLPFLEKKEILLSEVNGNLMLNQGIKKYSGKKYSGWGPPQIDARERDLLTTFSRIWPPAECFTERTPINRDSKPESKLNWVSMTQADYYQPTRFITYEEPVELSKIKTYNDKVIGVDRLNNQRTLKKLNTLFFCSVSSWSEVDPYIEILDFVKKQRFQPTRNPFNQLDIENSLLEKARDRQIEVFPVTRYGHELRGTIEKFDEEAIYMEIRECPVVVFRHGIYELSMDWWEQGEVTEFDTDRGFGYITSGERSDIYVHISHVQDKTVMTLEPQQKVAFQPNLTTRQSTLSSVGLSAINVILL